MSLNEPTKKMSKSDPKPKSRISINDSKDEIHNKLKTALTDSTEGVSYDREKRPGVSNMVDLIYHFEPEGAASPEELANDMKDLSMRALKERVADTVDKGIGGIRERYEELMSGDKMVLVRHAEEGANEARVHAARTIKRVRNAMGIRWGT
jgi:tryptophanyl-tRNA synthetase